MKIKNLIFSLLCTISITSFLFPGNTYSGEAEQKTRQEKKVKYKSFYEWILALFPGIESDLASKNISKQDINYCKGFKLLGDSQVHFEILHRAIDIKKNDKDSTKYIINIEKIENEREDFYYPDILL